MSTITCKKCGCQMSEQSESCPVCGTNVKQETGRNSGAGKYAVRIVAIIAAAVVLITWILSNY